MPWWKRKEKVIIPRRRKQKKKTCLEKYGPRACCIKLHNCWSKCRCCCRQMKRKYCPRSKKYARKKKDNEDVLLQKNSNYSLTALSGNIQLLRDADIGDLKATLKLSKSKEKILDKMLKDFDKIDSKQDQAAKNDKESKETMKNKKKKLKPSKEELSKINKEQVEALLNDYIKRKKVKKGLETKRSVLYEKPKDKALLPTLKKNKQEKIDLMLKDHKSGKFSPAGIPAKAKVTRAKLKQLLDKEEDMKKRGVSFAAITRVREVDRYIHIGCL